MLVKGVYKGRFASWLACIIISNATNILIVRVLRIIEMAPIPNLSRSLAQNITGTCPLSRVGLLPCSTGCARAVRSGGQAGESVAVGAPVLRVDVRRALGYLAVEAVDLVLLALSRQYEQLLNAVATDGGKKK